MARQAGTPNRDKGELRALIQERVHEFTELRHAEDMKLFLSQGMTEDEARAKAQPIIEDYDPVVQLSILAVDSRAKQDVQVRCAAEVAQYVRPKLKSVEVTTDPEALETLAERQALSAALVGLLTAAASAKKAEPTPPPAPSSEDPA